MAGKRVMAGFLSLLVPGAGQVYAGARRRGLVLLAVSSVLAVGLLLALAKLDIASLLDGRLFAAFLLANAALLAFRLFAIVDAWRTGARGASLLAMAALVAIAAAAAAPHVAAAYVAVRGHEVLDTVFADAEPRDVLPAPGVFLVPERDRPFLSRVWPGGIVPETDAPLPAARWRRPAPPLGPWVTIALLGSDAGPGQWGERTDTMIVAALEQGTGRAAAFGVPRNLVEVPLAGAAARSLPRFREPLNALYAFARTRPELFPGGRDPGATAVKQTLSNLLGIRVDYYALVDLKGFADMVDALGGVDIRVRERLYDEVTRPAWGEPKPTIDVYPGRTYHFFGREALAYVRSRKTSNDYARMERQRCFLAAMARQVDVVSVLRRFGTLAATVETSVRTDVPLARLPDLIRLARAVQPRSTLTQTFGPAYFARRRAADRFPVPNVTGIRATVRDMILRPERPRAAVRSIRQAC